MLWLAVEDSLGDTDPLGDEDWLGDADWLAEADCERGTAPSVSL